MILLNIALADDDADDQLLFARALKEVNKEAALQTYDDGNLLMEALLRPDAELPQVIFLDLNMPRKNGLQCLEEIRSHERLKPIPVIVLTTSISQVQINKVYDKGAVFYCRKPSEFSILVRLIEKVLSMDTTVSRKLTSF